MLMFLKEILETSLKIFGKDAIKNMDKDFLML